MLIPILRMGWITKCLVYVAKNTNLHAIRHIVDERRSLTFRFFWAFIIIFIIYFMQNIIRATYTAYRNDPISFVTETTYLDWNTTFPAVTVCEISNTEVFWTPKPNETFSPIQEFITDIIFFTGSCYSCSNPCDECSRFNYRQLVLEHRRKCSDLLLVCKWNEKEFDCCKHFLPVDTEYGICFTINSIHSKGGITLKSNRKTGPGSLAIRTLDDVRVYIHAPEDVPFINADPDLRKDIILGENYNITFQVIEIENDEDVQYLPVDRRRCRFPWEKTEKLYVHDHYSYSTCIVQCHAEAHLKLCNCTHHLMPKLSDTRSCDVAGLLCLTENFETVNRLHAKDFDKPGLVCDCEPSCVEPEYKIVSESKGMQPEFSEIQIKLQNLPTIRFKRKVVRTLLDLVGSIGGIIGSCIGASILSMVEFLFLLFKVFLARG